MLINIIFFAKYREHFGAPELGFEASEAELRGQGTLSVEALIALLELRYGQKVSFLQDPKLIISVNEVVSRPGETLQDGDTVAFFPPVSGG